ncbi:hypothetical protein COV89_03215 [Candidatus Shapirobacteria bacterium CG11_big_fil_rev_8_21_14_0_20_40_12]|uniref:PIN domain-containing protein n=1 Tax=Candidatus Shapirobacteria bacterium CG11_big_fil_rev_8_21_14_0_20_40_12 TaxID=1974889 RepID=A0A2H0KFF0_9BACT|nr:MAG: hypothetical protein COV89_03215 [Candidatus Shapirobacteria bacterium CG11_big_fil_rev_8_21_14_0_20_40_12]
MKKLRLYTDSDVIISSLISQSGAASFIFSLKNINLFASNYSKKETKIVAERLGLKEGKVNELFGKKLEVVLLEDDLEKIKEKFADCVTDKNDAHIVAGAVKAKAQFLISYNLRHYKADKIKTDFGMLLMTPAMFLQYLRSK